MSSSIVSPFPFFTDTTGAPLESGYIYIGQSNLNPETAPVNVFWDAALTIPAPNPVRTVGGYPSRAGTPSKFYSATDTYSITVRNKNHALVFSALDQTDSPNPGLVISTQIITATAGQTEFTLSALIYTPGTNTLQVYRNGLRLNLSLDYSEINSSTVTLTAPADAGDEFLFENNVFIIGDQTPETLSFDISTQLITASSGQTEFVLSAFTYLPGSNTLQVYRNGLKLNLVYDYLETTSSTITLTSPATAGDQFLFQGDAVIIGSQTPGTSVSFIQAGTGAVTRDIQDKAREIVSVKDFGAVGNGTVDDTTAIQAAINYLQSTVGSNNFGGGILHFPAGKYKVTGTLSITSSFITLQGCGTQSTYVEFANQSKDCLVINGASVSGGIRYVRVLDMSLNGKDKTAGATIKLLHAYRCVFQRLSVEYCITGFDISIATNDITLRDIAIVPSLAGSLYGIYWHCPIDGSYRSDVLTLHNVVVEGNWSNATCIMWEGFCNTMVASHLRLLHAEYGLRVRNVGTSLNYYPQLLNAFDIEAEGFKKRAISIEAGACFKITASDINNLTGGIVEQGNADDYAMAILADDGGSYTRSIQVDSSRLGLCRSSGLYSNGWDVQFSNCIFVSTSKASAGNAPVIKLDTNSRDVLLSNIRCEEYGGVALASYGVQIENGAVNVQISNLNATYVQTAAVNNLSLSNRISILNCVEPGAADATYFSAYKNNETQCGKKIDADKWVFKVKNVSTENLSESRVEWQTGVNNCYAIAGLHNGVSAPYWQLSTGPAVGLTYYDSPKHIFRDIASNKMFSIGEALGNFSNDSSAAAGGVPLYGFYRNGNVVQQRVV